MKPLDDSYRLVGDRIYLRPITIDDIGDLLFWRNAPFVVNNFFYRNPISYEEQVNWINNKVKTGEVFQFIVCLKDDAPVGCVYLQHFDEKAGAMESGVFMSVNAPKGQGIGTEAVSLMNREFAFKTLKLNKTFARVIDGNIGSLRLHEKAGFTEIGRCEDTIIPTGEKVTSVEFELINKDK